MYLGVSLGIECSPLWGQGRRSLLAQTRKAQLPRPSITSTSGTAHRRGMRMCLNLKNTPIWSEQHCLGCEGRRRKWRNLTGQPGRCIVIVTWSSPSWSCSHALQSRIRVPWLSKTLLNQIWFSYIYQQTFLPCCRPDFSTWTLHFSKLICTKCFSNITVRTEQVSCNELQKCNTNTSQPTGMGSLPTPRILWFCDLWFFQHCPQPNCSVLCIEALGSCAECCMWSICIHVLLLDRALNFCSTNALISCLTLPHSHRWGCAFVSLPCVTPSVLSKIHSCTERWVSTEGRCDHMLAITVLLNTSIHRFAPFK